LGLAAGFGGATTAGVVLGLAAGFGGATTCNLELPATWSQALLDASVAPALAFAWPGVTPSSDLHSEASLALATTARTGFLGVLGQDSRRFFTSEFGLAGEATAPCASCAEADACVDVPAPAGVPPAGVLKILLSFGVRTGCRGLLPRGVSNAKRTSGDPWGVGELDSLMLAAFLPCMAAGGSMSSPLLGFGEGCCGVPPAPFGLSTSAARSTSIVSGSKTVGDLSCTDGVLHEDASLGAPLVSSAALARGLDLACGVPPCGGSTGKGGEATQTTFPEGVLTTVLLCSDVAVAAA